MKKKIVSIVLAAVMVASLTTACGGDNKSASSSSSSGSNTQTAASASTDTKTDTPAPATNNDNAAAADGDSVSDEAFAQMQNTYGMLTEYYNAIVDVYTDDAVAANPEIDDVMNQARELIEQMGEISQAELTVADAEDLLDAMELTVDGLAALMDKMELTDDAAAGDSEMVSDETFAALQENYEALTLVYNTIAEAYNNGAEENADIVDTMNQAYDIIEQMGEISQDSITEADAVELVNHMVQIVEVLAVVADAM